MSDCLIEFKQVKFSRENRVIFEALNLTAQRGKIVAIMGPSGSGKTTILKLISGQLTQDAGSIKVQGQEVKNLDRDKLHTLRQNMGMLFQSGALFTNLSVFENVAFPLREHFNLDEELIEEVVLIQLEMVGLRGAAALMPSELSGGMARRVSLARSLVTNPSIMLYDEPFTGQDPITMGVLIKLIKELNDALGLTSVIVSHDVAETLSIADYVYMIAGGALIGEGSPSEIKRSHSPLIKQFINGLVDGPIPFHYPAKAYIKDLGL